MEDFNNGEMSILDIKAHYHGMKYANEVFKLLPLELFIHLTWWLDG